MKHIILAFVVAFLVLAPTAVMLACDVDTQIIISSPDNRLEIEVPMKEVAKDRPYDIVYTETGCDVIIHFEGATK